MNIFRRDFQVYWSNFDRCRGAVVALSIFVSAWGACMAATLSHILLITHFAYTLADLSLPTFSIQLLAQAGMYKAFTQACTHLHLSRTSLFTCRLYKLTHVHKQEAACSDMCQSRSGKRRMQVTWSSRLRTAITWHLSTRTRSISAPVMRLPFALM